MAERWKTLGAMLLITFGGVVILILTFCTLFIMTTPKRAETPQPTAAPTVIAYLLDASLEDVTRGEEYFNRYCIGCHGPGGVGTNIAPSFVERPPLSLEFITQQVRTGSSLMPPLSVGTIPNEDLYQIVSYLQSIGGTAQRVLTADQLVISQEIYATTCQTCHGDAGQGVPDIGTPLTVSPPRSYGQIAARVRDDLHGFSDSTLTEEQLQLLVVYVQGMMTP